MNRIGTLIFALITLLAAPACASDHGHDHGPGAGHSHGAPAAAPDPAPTAPAAAAVENEPAVESAEPAADAASSSAVELMLGTWDATLEPTESTLRLVVVGADGTAVDPTGDAKVVLTGVGEEEQRVTLSPTDGGWSGPAKAAGAAGYVAVVSVTLDGTKQSGRVTWGEVPEPAAAPAHDHGDGGHDHGGADHGHAH